MVWCFDWAGFRGFWFSRAQRCSFGIASPRSVHGRIVFFGKMGCFDRVKNWSKHGASTIPFHYVSPPRFPQFMPWRFIDLQRDPVGHPLGHAVHSFPQRCKRAYPRHGSIAQALNWTLNVMIEDIKQYPMKSKPNWTELNWTELPPFFQVPYADQ